MTRELDYTPRILHITGRDYIDDLSIPYTLLAEGDSWFSLGSFPAHNILKALRFARDTRIISLAKSGDTICRMASRADNPLLNYYLCKQGCCSPFKMILLSGGGNDLIDEAKGIVNFTVPQGADPGQAKSYINQDRLTVVLDAIRDGYRKIAEFRDSVHSLSRNVPIVTHTYAYPTPRKAPALIAGTNAGAIGPWLYTLFDGKNLSRELQIGITDIMFNQLARAILKLNDEIGNFHAIDTRSVLDRAGFDVGGTSGDWENEIHPNGNGYAKIASILSEEIDKCLNTAM